MKKLFIAGLIFSLSFGYIYDRLPNRLEISLDKSLPYHVWWAYRCDGIKKGDYVEFKVDWDDKYFKGAYLIKKVACDEGEILETRGRDYYCNTDYLGEAVDRDGKGNPVSNFYFYNIIPYGKMFVMGTHQRSYDSRYFGLIDKSKVIRCLKPLY